MKQLIMLLCICATLQVHAQEFDEFKPASKESQAYHAYRLKVTTPPYELATVKALIAKIETRDNDNGDYEAIGELPADIYNKLSLRAKFTYNMINPEYYAQNCDIPMPIQDEHKKIFGALLSAYPEQYWSKRQVAFFKDNKDSVMSIMKESILRSKRIGVNYKEAIVDMNAVEMIPFLQEFYLIDKKDHDILTIFLLLMKENKYEPLLKSATYKKLYSDQSIYNAYIDYNAANEALILERVNDFYKNYKR
ncbi:hypothetical protein LX64_01354 [Chitinophaga skermanii]|uniref:DUF4919 domain-containing protein n=1 Tax=Chitinophaga skermanii TaxID=331697 RepID=A0A327QWG8_9BACT|nr:hypothetical protein [Chitinophaga skermanii]RAJ08700.1 hypothetical protein LX64_01354 [Chitinophaga skermanii]